MSDATALSNTLAVFVATYLLHSTLLLAACWVLLKLSRVSSHFLVERMWKLAAVLGLVTASLQMVVGSQLRTQIEPSPSDALAHATSGVERVPDAEDSLLGVPYLDGVDVPSDVLDYVALPPSRAESLLDRRVNSTVMIDQHLASQDEPSQAEPGTVVEPSMRAEVIAAEARVAERGGYVGGASGDASDGAKLPMTDATNSAIEPAWWNALRATSPWVAALFSIAIGGCIVAGGVLLAIQSLRLRSRFATARLLEDGPVRRVLDRFLKRHKIRRRIKLLSSTKQTEPVTYGLFAWTIVLPEDTEEQLGRDELKALLAHEVAHLVRGDVWWLWIGRVLCICLAFQPLNWLARRRWQQAAEYLCDDWAVERGVRSISLARCLTQIAEWRFGQQGCEVELAAGGTKATLVQRVERLVEDDRRADVWTKPPCRRLLTLGAAVAVIGLAGFAPRIALPLAAVSEIAEVNQTDKATTHDWRALEEELLQLEADLERINELLTDRARAALVLSPPRDVEGRDRARTQDRLVSLVDRYLQNLNQRAATLRARREHIASLLRKDSER